MKYLCTKLVISFVIASSSAIFSFSNNIVVTGKEIAEFNQPLNVIARVSKETGANFLLLKKIAMCESSLNHNAIGDKGLARGIFQFHEETFNFFKKRFNLPDLEYMDINDQTLLTAIAIKGGLGSHWSCFRRLVRE